MPATTGNRSGPGRSAPAPESSTIGDFPANAGSRMCVERGLTKAIFMAFARCSTACVGNG
jgi:hypothetical protein